METLGRGVADAGERLKGLRETLSFREKGVISDENRLKDVQRTLSDISFKENVKTGFEPIVESALGHLIQAMVIENKDLTISRPLSEGNRQGIACYLAVAGTPVSRKGDAVQEIVTARPPADGFIENIASGLSKGRALCL